MKLLGILKVFVVGFILVELVYLHYTISTYPKPVADRPLEIIEPIQPVSITPADTSLLAATQDLVTEATVSLTQRVEALENRPTSTTSTPSRAASELYIPLGTGSTDATEWVDLPGVEAYVVPSNYASITEIYFEANLRVPTNVGRAYARLKNVTDNTTLIESELSREGSTGGIVSSGRIPVPTSTKLYRVQLKSTLGATVALDNARLKLFVR